MMAKTINFKLDGSDVVVSPASFLANDFGSYRAACTAGGARFDSRRKANVTTLAKVADVAQALRRAGFELALQEALRSLVVEAAAETAQIEVEGAADVAALIEAAEAVASAQTGRAMKAYAFQHEGVASLINNRRWMLTDEMGLGKSIQVAIALPKDAPIVIVCPSTLKLNWRNELRTWRPDLAVTVLSGRDALKVWPAPGQVFILNFDILSDVLPADAPANLCVVADEAHNFKNYKAKRSVRMTALAAVAHTAWALTGTPLMNQPLELWAVLSVFGLAVPAFGSFSGFIRLFNGYKGSYGYTFSGTPSAQVETCLRRVSLGRRRVNVLPDLPVKTHQIVPVEIDAKTIKLCDAMMKALADRGLDIEALMGDVAAQVESFRRAQDEAETGDSEDEVEY